MRLLVFIVSYNAETTIETVFEDLPANYKNNSSTEILLVDDASHDKTVEVAKTYLAKNKITNARVLKNRINQGYGGNQKVGYRYAIDNKFDAVVMTHGDAQYTLKALPELMQPFLDDDAVDCVLGVRFGQRYSPLKGGMPFYKYIGNRILTSLQNRMARTDLREWHTGYRVYRTRALNQIAFELNTNDFHFDTEIILQLVQQKCKISQVNIPTHYGDEICRVNGMKYAVDVLKASLKYRLQSYHLFYDVRFHPHVVFPDRVKEMPNVYESKIDAMSPHSLICKNKQFIPENSRVLDIGCASGYVSKFLKEHKNCTVVGVDMLPADQISADLDEYYQIDLESEVEKLNSIIEKGKFDVIIMLDVIEHLSNPEIFLLKLHEAHIKDTTKFIFSTGNVAFFVMRIMLLLGFFNYGQRGLLDITHKRLFSVRTFKNALEQTGFIVKKKYFIPFPYHALGFSTGMARFFQSLNAILIKVWKSLFSYQVVVVASRLIPPTDVLKDTLAEEKKGSFVK